MKNILIAGLLCLLTACDSSQKSEAPHVVELKLEPTQVTDIEEQFLKLPGDTLHVKSLQLMKDGQETHVLVVIRTENKEEVSFSFDLKSRFLKSPLSAKEVQFVQEQAATKALELDLNVQGYAQSHSFLNRLQLDRCRTAPVWKELKHIMESERSTLYFDITPYAKTLNLLKYDLKSKTFKGFVKTYDTFEGLSGQIKTDVTLLTPVVNPKDAAEIPYLDSVFLSFENFSSACDSQYDPKWNSGTPDFLPRYKFEYDVAQSDFISGLGLAECFYESSSFSRYRPRYSPQDIKYLEEEQNLSETKK